MRKKDCYTFYGIGYLVGYIAEAIIIAITSDGIYFIRISVRIQRDVIQSVAQEINIIIFVYFIHQLTDGVLIVMAIRKNEKFFHSLYSFWSNACRARPLWLIEFFSSALASANDLPSSSA